MYSLSCTFSGCIIARAVFCCTALVIYSGRVMACASLCCTWVAAQGGCPKHVNDGQWEHMKMYYFATLQAQGMPGLYVAPRKCNSIYYSVACIVARVPPPPSPDNRASAGGVKDSWNCHFVGCACACACTCV